MRTANYKSLKNLLVKRDAKDGSRHLCFDDGSSVYIPIHTVREVYADGSTKTTVYVTEGNEMSFLDEIRTPATTSRALAGYPVKNALAKNDTNKRRLKHFLYLLLLVGFFFAGFSLHFLLYK